MQRFANDVNMGRNPYDMLAAARQQGSFRPGLTNHQVGAVPGPAATTGGDAVPPFPADNRAQMQGVYWGQQFQFDDFTRQHMMQQRRAQEDHLNRTQSQLAAGAHVHLATPLIPTPVQQRLTSLNEGGATVTDATSPHSV